MDCPKLKIQNAIQKCRVTENLSYIEAELKVNIHTPKPNIPLALANSLLFPAPSVFQINIQDILCQIGNVAKKNSHRIILNSEFKTPKPFNEYIMNNGEHT